MWLVIKEVIVEFFWRLWGYLTAQPLAKPSTEADGEKYPSDETRDEILDTIGESALWRSVQERASKDRSRAS
jgi:hypothetical protein